MAFKRRYIGWSTQNVTPSSSTTNLYDENLIKQDILNEFMTKQGDRVMLPQFGSVIWNLLFEGMLDQNIQAIEDDAKRIIGNDPRVSYLDMNIIQQDHGITLSINILYNESSSTDNLLVDFNTSTNSLT